MLKKAKYEKLLKEMGKTPAEAKKAADFYDKHKKILEAMRKGTMPTHADFYEFNAQTGRYERKQ
jgi:predicted metallo-beta-lactamase superfamily hydrolase